MMNRRHFTSLVAGAPALAGFGAGLGRNAQAQVSAIRMVEAGGKSGESIEEGYIKPFTAKTGVKVVRESPNQLGKLRSLVESRSTGTTLFELGSGGFEQAKALGLVETLDWAKINPDPMFPEAKAPQGFGYQYYSTLMAWRSDAKAPASWADFFNVQAFPGRRTLPDEPQFTLPAAAMAAGIAPDKLYPLDLDRIFKQLDSFKKNVSIWWQAGAQAPQLLKDNEVQYAMAYSGRVAGQDGVKFTFKQGLLDLAYFVVVKNAKPAEIEMAYKLLHEMSVAKNQARAAEVISYTGASPELEKLLPQARLNEFPTTTENKSVQVLTDTAWWFKNADQVQRRWEEFKLNL